MIRLVSSLGFLEFSYQDQECSNFCMHINYTTILSTFEERFFCIIATVSYILYIPSYKLRELSFKLDFKVFDLLHTCLKLFHIINIFASFSKGKSEHYIQH